MTSQTVMNARGVATYPYGIGYPYGVCVLVHTPYGYVAIPTSDAGGVSTACA